jgi:hypothetical protein
MSTAVRPYPAAPSRFLYLTLAVLLGAVASVLAGGGPPSKSEGRPKPAATRADSRHLVEIHFVDGSALKVTLWDERIPLSTPYGKLRIPAADVRRIDFATRVPAEVRARVEQAVRDLGSREFRRREAASAALRKLGAWGYPALLDAARHKDPEVVRRAEGLLTHLRETVPEDRLVIRKHDVVYTDDSKFSGEIEVEAFQATTTQFGEVRLKLTDMRGLGSGAGGTGGPASPGVGDRVQVLWGNRWWQAEIVRVKDGKYLIHYAGWDASNDEWVGRERIRTGTEKPAAPKEEVELTAPLPGVILQRR